MGRQLVTNDTPEWLAAFGTIGAVAVALFLEPARRWWRRPRFSPCVSGIEPHVRPVFHTGGGALLITRKLYRVEIRNHGRGVAWDVRARLVDAWIPDMGSWGSLAVDPVPLAWVSRGVRSGRGDVESKVNISPGGSDLIEVLEVDSAGGTLRLVVDDEANVSFPTKLAYAARYRIEIEVSAEHVRPLPVVIEFERSDGGELVPSLGVRPERARSLGLYALVHEGQSR